MKETNNSVTDFIGCGFSSLIGLAIFTAISMFMFWVCMQCMGVKL